MRNSATPALMVFSHPNHETAVLGSIRRLQPHIVFLTDGGGQERMDQSREGLKNYLSPDSLTFLGHKEKALYNALLKGDVDFYRNLALQLRAVLQKHQPQKLYCDAVEFYNPVHDMALPVVRTALNGEAVEVFEVPLIYEKADARETFAVQRVPNSLRDESIMVELSAEELAEKASTLQGNTYKALFGQGRMKEMIGEAVSVRGKIEEFLKARGRLPKPAPEQALRYDHRGKTLKSSGAVKEAISYEEHYAPMFENLLSHKA